MRMILLFVCYGLFCLKSNAQEANSLAEGQALFIYNFTKFVAWPIEQKTPEFIIGILGPFDTFDPIKNYMQQKRVAGRTIVVKHFRKVSEIESNCHILMIASQYVKDMETIVTKTQSENVLLITEKDGSIEKGAAINFLVIDGKIKYEIKGSNIAKYQLKHALQLETLAYRKYD